MGFIGIAKIAVAPSHDSNPWVALFKDVLNFNDDLFPSAKEVDSIVLLCSDLYETLEKVNSSNTLYKGDPKLLGSPDDRSAISIDKGAGINNGCQFGVILHEINL